MSATVTSPTLSVRNTSSSSNNSNISVFINNKKFEKPNKLLNGHQQQADKQLNNLNNQQNMSSTPEGQQQQQQQQLPRLSDDQQHYVSDRLERVDTVRTAVRMNGTQNASSGMARSDFAPQQLSNGPHYYHHHPVIHEDVQHHHEHDDHDHHEVDSLPLFVECQPKLSSTSSTAAFMQTPSVIAASLDSGSCSPIRSHSSPTPSSPSSTTTTDPRRTITTTMTGRLLSHQGSSQALLFVPEQRRVSTISGHSVRSCPTDICHSGLKDVEDGAESPVVGAAELDRHEEEEADEFHQLLIHSPSNNSVPAAAEHVGPGASRSVSPRAQAASDAYCRMYGNGTGAESVGEQQQQHHHHLPLNQQQNRLLAVIHDRNRKTSPPGDTASGSRISSDFGRRRSLHTGAPAIAFRSTLSFAAAVAGANAGRIGGVALGGGTTARNSACQQQRRPLFQRRSSQPIIYSGAAGAASSAAGMRYTPNHQHRAAAMQQQQKAAAAADQNNRFQQCRFNIGMSGSPISVGGGGGICAGTDSGGSGGTPISCGGKISASGVPTLHGATMHGPPTSFLAKRVSWLSMKSLQDCAATQQQLQHKHASAEQCTLRGGGGQDSSGCCMAGTPASILGGSRSRNKRDSASIGAEFGGISGGGGAIACKISTDTRSNSQLGSLLQLNNSIGGGGGGGYASAAGRGGGQSDADELTIGFDPLECPDTPPMDTMSWSNMDEFDNVTLMYSKHEKIPMKDFGSEIRATMDIDHLLNKAVLLLDLQETSLEEIFAKIIHEMDIQEPEFTSEQVRSVLFTQDAGNQFHILSRTVQSICTTGTVGGTFDYDQTWICALCMLNTVQHRHVAIARLSHPTNLGRTMQDLRFIIIVIAPSRAKGTKTALETTRTFATLFADMDIRQRLVMANTVDMFRATLLEAAKELAMEQSQWRDRKTSNPISAFGLGKFFPFRGMVEDLKRRKRHYVTDYLDGLRGHRTAQKMFSSIIFLYFACLLPAIAFGVLNDDNTGGGINVRKGILAQAIGGIFFAVFGGQPMIILLTTVPLAIYIKVIYRISEALGYDFFAMYACVGLWCQFFLILYAGTELCSLMKLATRSAEEMFSLFIAIAFTVESIRAIHTSFMNNYEVCEDAQVVAEKAELARRHQQMNQQRNLSLLQKIINPELHHNFTQVHYSDMSCHRDTSILYLLLMFGTLWLAMFLYNFRKTPYLTRSRREWLADYALPASVLIMSFVGAYSFSEIDKDMFKMRPDVPLFRIPEFWRLSWQAILVCFLLGFFLSFLFYMDQNICSAIVNNGQNKLKKGSSQHLDMFVVAILNMFLSIVGLPWMHGALPHSPLHLRALADVEERVAQGHVHEVIMNVRETRLATLVAHLLILGSAFCLLPFPLQWIPTSVLHGLFLYMAFTSLTGNEMVERLLLLITEQQAYPPTHYIRRVPQRKVHLFTACQLIQLIILCAVGFSPYPFIEMVFPIVCFCFLPIRHILIPRLIDYKYLDALDGRH
uniref:Bicarbonate transporter-like transmembrane domain-containing protein n=1 Tax=Globodera rostochiensis TaxID=31243 RepID=A0A914I7G5_GLORO